MTALPLPRLERFEQPFLYWSDPELSASGSASFCFTSRREGQSDPPFDSLNLSGQVGDDPEKVRLNRKILTDAMGLTSEPLIIPHQVHGTDYLVIDETFDDKALWAIAPETHDCDAVILERDATAAMLCFADCVPLVVVTPARRIAVVHAGWRGVLHSIIVGVVAFLGKSEDPATFNVYIGPHIGAECFECGSDTYDAFVQKFGPDVAYSATCIDLGAALRKDLAANGVDGNRIADVNLCTVCDNEELFSYRAQDGHCGRQGALVWRRGNTSMGSSEE